METADTIAICAHCREKPATSLARHGGKTLGVCSVDCSKGYCVATVRKSGPKVPTNDGETRISQAGNDARDSKYSHNRRETQLWAADVVLHNLRTSAGAKILIARRILLYAPNREDVFDPVRAATTPESIVWQVEAHFDVRRSDFVIDAQRIDQNTTQEERDPNEIAQLAIVHNPAFNGYVKLTHLINFMTGPRSTDEEKFIFRGVAVLLLKSVLVYLMARYPWMFPKGRETLVGIEAGSMRLNTKSGEIRDQIALVAYYRTLGFVEDRNAPSDPFNNNTARMSATVETILSKE